MTNFQKTKRCSWLLSGVGEFPERRCGAAVRYHMVRDDDDNLVRKYEHFCETHKKRADEEDAEEAKEQS